MFGEPKPLVISDIGRQGIFYIERMLAKGCQQRFQPTDLCISEVNGHVDAVMGAVAPFQPGPRPKKKRKPPEQKEAMLVGGGGIPVLKVFNQNEQRDKTGKWTTDGSGPGSDVRDVAASMGAYDQSPSDTHPERYEKNAGFGVHLREGETETRTGVDADTANNEIRKIAGGIIDDYVGSPAATPGISPDGSAATSAINAPHAVRLDGAGNLFYDETGNEIVRELVGSPGTLQTIAGTPPPSSLAITPAFVLMTVASLAVVTIGTALRVASLNGSGEAGERLQTAQTYDSAQ